MLGYLCYTPLLPKPTDKFASNGRKCVFIGYPLHQKGYKLLDLDTHAMFIARDVIFHEEVFPFKQSTSISTPSLVSFHTDLDDHHLLVQPTCLVPSPLPHPSSLRISF